MSLQLPSFDGPDTEAERIALRRVAEASRRTRVLDSRARTLGVDVAYLQQQVEERRAAARAEAEEDLARATADREAFLAVAEAEATEGTKDENKGK